MRALVAESNAVTRVTLRRILERVGFDVHELRDELAAMCLLYQPEAPELALLALDTVLVDFEQICTAMRQAKPDVFIVALVPAARRPELMTVLASGADDFMIKPVTIQEAEARIFAIQRLLHIHVGLPPPTMVSSPTPSQPPSRALPDVLLAAAPLPEDAAEQPIQTDEEPLPPTPQEADEALPPEPEPEPTPEAPAEAPAEAPGHALSQLLPSLDVASLIHHVFNRMGIREAGPNGPSPAVGAPYYTGWVAFLLHGGEEAEWINVRLDLDRDHGRRLLRLTNQPDAQVIAQLREIMGLIQDAFHQQTRRHRDLGAYLPVGPRALHAEHFPPLTSLTARRARQAHTKLTFAPGLALRLHVTAEKVRMVERSIIDLQRLDVLASPIQTADSHMLLRAGILLTDDYINKIRGFSFSQTIQRKVSVFRPPSGIAVFLNEMLLEA